MPAAESLNWVLDETTTWTPYHHNYTQSGLDGRYLLRNAPHPEGDFAAYNETSAAVQRLIREARNARELRPVGSGWSMSRICATKGRLLNNKNLKFIIPIHHPAQHDPNFSGAHRRIYCCQAGMTIKSISRELERDRMSLPTSGASDGQTIAGALSTGTHGAAIQFGAIPEFVVGLHLATGKTSTIWLERESYPVLSSEMVEFFGAKLVRNDDQFNAALVGLGAFGMLLSVTIEAVPLYLLEVHTKELPVDDLMRRAMETGDSRGLQMGHPDQSAYSFNIIINPHRPETAFTALMYKRRYRSNYPRHDFSDPDSPLTNDGLEFLAGFIDLLPVVGDLVIPSVVTRELESRFGEVSGVLGTHREVFGPSNLRGKVSSSAIAVPAADSPRALQLFLDVHDDEGPLAGALGIRFVKGTSATLGFTRFPRTCVIETDGLDNALSRRLNQALWRAFAQSDIPHAIHWGKINDLSPSRVRAMYGDAAVESWLAARRKLVPPSTRDVFSSPFLRKAGLA